LRIAVYFILIIKICVAIILSSWRE